MSGSLSNAMQVYLMLPMKRRDDLPFPDLNESANDYVRRLHKADSRLPETVEKFLIRYGNDRSDVASIPSSSLEALNDLRKQVTDSVSWDKGFDDAVIYLTGISLNGNRNDGPILEWLRGVMMRELERVGGDVDAIFMVPPTTPAAPLRPKPQRKPVRVAISVLGLLIWVIVRFAFVVVAILFGLHKLVRRVFKPKQQLSSAPRNSSLMRLLKNTAKQRESQPSTQSKTEPRKPVTSKQVAAAKKSKAPRKWGCVARTFLIAGILFCLLALFADPAVNFVVNWGAVVTSIGQQRPQPTINPEINNLVQDWKPTVQVQPTPTLVLRGTPLATATGASRAQR